MRKTIVVMLLAVVSSSAVAEWVAFSKNKADADVYADPDTVRKAGNRVKMWNLADYKTAQLFPNGKPYLSAIIQFEYDCKEERVRMLYSSWHSKNMGKGKVVDSDSDPGHWTPVPRSSVDEDLWKFACSNR